ncbi:MAG TPA: CUAEP/CCAEP-tail radical SAM protein [Bryobacteraceae bacterium]|nr:CUAEP/CCAEP-tail radical SAM protein [Bryobacteraceae bacterium]
MKVALISTYEMGRQPFGLASPAAWLERRGHEVVCIDASRRQLPLAEVADAGLIAFHLPMHTATRLAVPLISRILAARPDAHICCYGLYAPMNEPFLREQGVRTILGGEFEKSLADLADGAATGAATLDRLRFITPVRAQLPGLGSYAKLKLGNEWKTAGYTEASRGCKHLCRHCPVVPVYNGAFRVVQRDVVLADIRQQAAAGAEHITFGDPDFFNGPGHAMAIVNALHAEFPELTYDVTIKIEHLLKHRDLLPGLRRTGCLFVVSAAESIDDEVLARLDKGHTRADFAEAACLMRRTGLTLSPTFITFTPWTTRQSYRELLETLAGMELVENVAPIQLAMRLLIPAGSRLLELPEVRRIAGRFDPSALAHPWRHEDPSIDGLCVEIQRLIQREEGAASRGEMFGKIRELATGEASPPDFHLPARATIPYLNEPWYC